VESLHKHHGETEAVAIHRTIFDMAKEGWELVEACGDEIRMPSLIFKPLVRHAIIWSLPFPTRRVIKELMTFALP